MKYAWYAPSAIVYVSSFVNVGSGIQKKIKD
jgi:hypothetical protein